MNFSKRTGFLAGAFFMLFFVFVDNAFAYLDPGTGSYIIQMILAAVLGIGVAIRLFWGRIKNFLKKMFSK